MTLPPLLMPLLLQHNDNTTTTTTEGSSSSSSQAAPVSFPCKLYALLEDAEQQGFDDVISWQVTGKSFKIHKPDDFMETIVKRYSFACGKLKSFQRQLNIYGFKKVSMGPQKGGYQHKQFVRGKPERLVKISRQRTSKDFKEAVDKKILEDATNTLDLSSGMSSSSGGGGVFDFQACFEASPPQEPPQQQPCPPKIHLEESEVSNLYEFFYPKDMETRRHIQKVLSDEDNDDETSATSFSSSSSSSSLEQDSAHHHIPRTTSTQINPDATSALLLDSIDLDDFCDIWHDENELVNHDGPVTSCGPATTTTIHNEEDDAISPSDDLTFPFKLHLMLSNAERDNYSDVVSWTPSGDAFYVHKVDAFVEQVLPLFFDQSKYESFRRQLNLYQFQRVSKGKERGRISHPRFVRGARWMCQDIHSVRRR